VCSGFLQAPGTAPAETGVSSTAGCRDLCTVVGVHTYLLLNTNPVTFTLGVHPQIPTTGCPAITVLDCSNNQWGAFCGGEAVVNGSMGGPCQCTGNPTATQPSSWGNLKAIFE
jgi:hypothetical protein